jgi:hypothetical protein
VAVLYADQLALAKLLKIRAWTEAQARQGDDPEQRRRRPAIHEAGHAMVYLVRGVRFANVRLSAPAGLHHRDVDDPPTTRETRIAMNLGGAVAEALSLGACDPSSAWSDLRSALARAMEDVGVVRGIVVDVRELLVLWRTELILLTDALLEEQTLTCEQCVELVQVCELTFGPRGPDDEEERAQAARAPLDR